MAAGIHQCHMTRCSHKDLVRRETFGGIQSYIQNFKSGLFAGQSDDPYLSAIFRLKFSALFISSI